jgi:hypothetical protein
MFTNKKKKKAAWDEFIADNAARECGTLVSNDGIKLGPVDLNNGRKLSRLFDVDPKDYEADEDLDRERKQERFGRMQNEWVTGGHEQ